MPLKTAHDLLTQVMSILTGFGLNSVVPHEELQQLSSFCSRKTEQVLPYQSSR
jgi:hypothetical protein